LLTGSTEEKDLVIIGGGVAGYVAAIKAGQEGMKVYNPFTYPGTFALTHGIRLPALRSVVHLVEHA